MIKTFFIKIILLLIKENLFYDYFSKQCTTRDKDSSVSQNITFETEQKQSTFEICSHDIIKILKSLDSLQIMLMDTMKHLFDWYNYPLFQLENLCQFSLETDLKMNAFLKEWKKANIVPVHKKMISNWSKITDEYHYCHSVVKYLKK